MKNHATPFTQEDKVISRKDSVHHIDMFLPGQKMQAKTPLSVAPEVQKHLHAKNVMK